MASGKALGEFSFKTITSTYNPGPAGSVLDQVNWEGTAAGFGTVVGTATYVGRSKSGTFSAAGPESAAALTDDVGARSPQARRISKRA